MGDKIRIYIKTDNEHADRNVCVQIFQLDLIINVHHQVTFITIKLYDYALRVKRSNWLYHKKLAFLP